MGLWPNRNRREFPEFWKEYLVLFDKKSKKTPIKNIRFVAFDTETTGFDYIDDRILSIGGVAVCQNVIEVADQIEVYLKQDIFNSDTVEIHGDTISEIEAIEKFIKYIGNAILIAHHADFDKRMINKALQRNGLGTLKNKFIDTGVLFRKTKHLVYQNDRKHISYSLDELCEELKISKSDRHTASGDAFITAIAFLKIMSKLKINTTDKVSILF